MEKFNSIHIIWTIYFTFLSWMERSQNDAGMKTWNKNSFFGSKGFLSFFSMPCILQFPECYQLEFNVPWRPFTGSFMVELITWLNSELVSYASHGTREQFFNTKARHLFSISIKNATYKVFNCNFLEQTIQKYIFQFCLASKPKNTPSSTNNEMNRVKYHFLFSQSIWIKIFILTLSRKLSFLTIRKSNIEIMSLKMNR